LIQGVRDPLGGINSLWPLFGIANQLLAAIALCLATTVILKMQLQDSDSGRPIYAWITLAPLLWLLTATVTAGVEKIWHPDPTIGFLAAAAMAAAEPRLRFNDLLDAAVTGVFLLMILAIVALSVQEWIRLLARQKISRLSETLPVWLPDYAVAEGRPRGSGNLLFLALLLARELSGQTAVERAQERSCGCAAAKQVRVRAYLEVAQKRFDGINRCC
jgi:carbon starvation protein